MLAPFLAVVLGMALFLFEPLPLQVLRNAVFDQYQRWHPRPYRPVPVRIVDIDEESLERMGQWPWPRIQVAELIEKLQKAGAAVVCLDIIFAESDRTSPKSMAATWNLPDDLRRRLKNIPDHDDVLAHTLSKGRVVLGFALRQEGSEQTRPARPFRVVFAGEPPLAFLHPFSSAVTSIPPLERAAAGNGALTFIPDSDGIVRRIPLAVRLHDQVIFSITAESLRVAQGQSNYIVKTAAQKGTGIEEIRIGGISVPTTPQGEIWLHYTRPAPDRYLPAWQVLADKAPRERLEGHIVLVGTSSQGIMDLRFSPMGTIIPGVEIHAGALEQIFTKDYLNRPAWAATVEALVILAGGLALGIIALAAPAVVSSVMTALVLIAAGWGAWIAFTRYGLLLDPVTPALALLITFILGSIVHHMKSEREQRWIRGAFSRYVSPNRVEYLVKHPEQLELGGERRECSFIFTDLADYTTLMEKIDPSGAVSILNAYLDEMITIAFRHGGTLDRIVGDAVAIMFSAPVIQPDHFMRAFSCALDMHAFTRRYADDLNAKGIAFGQTRIGIHSGEVIVGNFGGSTMFDYRALGDVVNTASRLEAANKYLGTLICLSEAILTGCPAAVVRPVGSLILKGKSRSLMVYEPITASGMNNNKPERDAAYEKAFELLRQCHPNAREAFEQLALERPQDPLVLLHLERLRAGQKGVVIVLDDK
ncbi:MAG: adenylate/guanylate cyclase domain-containing protein [Deltaproteobacteria bacterium]|nr:adenylate/guanylate cyclase domain-containing protein [Deltaproteobacteria bacterium]